MSRRRPCCVMPDFGGVVLHDNRHHGGDRTLQDAGRVLWDAGCDSGHGQDRGGYFDGVADFGGPGMDSRTSEPDGSQVEEIRNGGAR